MADGCFVPRVQRLSDCLCSVPRVLVTILMYGTGTTLVMVLLCGTGTTCSTVCVSWYWYACVPICKLETLSGMSQLYELSVELVSTLSCIYFVATRIRKLGSRSDSSTWYGNIISHIIRALLMLV